MRANPNVNVYGVGVGTIQLSNVLWAFTVADGSRISENS